MNKNSNVFKFSTLGINSNNVISNVKNFEKNKNKKTTNFANSTASSNVIESKKKEKLSTTASHKNYKNKKKINQTSLRSNNLNFLKASFISNRNQLLNYLNSKASSLSGYRKRFNQTSVIFNRNRSSFLLSKIFHHKVRKDKNLQTFRFFDLYKSFFNSQTSANLNK